MINEIRIFFSRLILGFIFFLAGCESTQVLEVPTAINDPILIEKTHLSSFEIRINSILNDISSAKLELAQQKIEQLDKYPNNNTDAILLAYTQAKLMIAQNRTNEAYEYLNNKKITDMIALSDISIQTHTGILNANILTQKKLYLDAVKLRVFIAPLIENHRGLFEENHHAIWSALNQIPQDELENALQHTNDPTTQQWISLNIIYRNKNFSLDQKSKAIEQWYLNNPVHPAKTLPIAEITTTQLQAKKQHQQIAIILPFKGKYSSISEAITDGFMKSCYNSGYTPLVRFYNADESTSFITTYKKAIDDGANLVIGPLLKTHLDELYKMATLPVRTIALNKLPLPPKENLFQYSIGADDEISALITLAGTYNLANAFVLVQDDEFSQKNYNIFTSNWKASGANIISAHKFTETADLGIELENPLNLDASKERIDNIQNLLGMPLESDAKSRTDIDFIVLLTKPEPAREINALLSTHFSDAVPKYSISSIYRGFPDLQNDQDLNNIIFTEMPLVIASDEMKGQKYAHSPLIRLFALGMDTFELNSHLEQMLANSNYSIAGSSGEISLINGELYRKPVFAIFSNGKAMQFSSTLNSVPEN